jgi:acyl carrier protein
MQMHADPIMTRIKAFIAERFPAARHKALTADERLLENGILDSLGILDLVAYLEAEFQITVADDDLVPEHFETLDRLRAFVMSRERGGPQ